MAAPTADNVRVGLDATFRVAPVGTAAPADASVAYGTGWLNLGYSSEDGFTIGQTKDVEAISAHQTLYPVRRVVTGMDFTLAGTLRQWDKDTVAFALRASLSAPAVGQYKVVPLAPENLDERALSAEWKDGAKTYRLFIPRGMITDMGDVTIARTAAADLPFTFGIIATAGTDPWYVLSNDAALNPA